jgi:hypothetical protein
MQTQSTRPNLVRCRGAFAAPRRPCPHRELLKLPNLPRVLSWALRLTAKRAARRKALPGKGAPLRPKGQWAQRPSAEVRRTQPEIPSRASFRWAVRADVIRRNGSKGLIARSTARDVCIASKGSCRRITRPLSGAAVQEPLLTTERHRSRTCLASASACSFSIADHQPEPGRQQPRAGSNIPACSLVAIYIGRLSG